MSDETNPNSAESDVLRDLLGRDDEELIQVIARAIDDAQTDSRVEYKRRVGYAGRQSIAKTVLWRLREHSRVTPPGQEGTT